MSWLAPEDFQATSRFAVERRLGAVALKVLPKVEPEAIYRFKREFRSLADIVHPNLVTPYELVSDEDKDRKFKALPGRFTAMTPARPA